MTDITRRELIISTAALAGALSVGGSSAIADTRRERPVGPSYLPYERLYRSGDTVSKALERLTEPKVVTFPEGKFECSDFDSGYQSGIAVPRICRGIVGSGRGTLGGSTGTVFTIKRRSSTKGNGRRDPSGRPYIPKQDDSTPCQLVVLRQIDQHAPAVWRSFQVAGTDQGHIFNGFQVFNTAGANQFENLLVTGWDGDSGAPPGETYGLAVNGKGRHRLSGVEADGRRNRGGQVHGAMGITVQNTVGATLKCCYAHHTRAAAFVVFQSVNGQMEGCLSDARVPQDRAIGNGSINFERAAGWRVVDCEIIGRQRKVHITYSNDSWVLKQGASRYSVKNGALTVVGPRYNALWENGHFMIQSWTPYWTGDSMQTAPRVVKPDYKTNIPYSWVHGRSTVVY